jgi:AraC-like DNA-binding protein
MPVAAYRFVGPRGLDAFNFAVGQTLVSQTVEARDPATFHARLREVELGPTRLVSAAVGPLHAHRRAAQTSAGSVFLLLSTKADGRIGHRRGAEPITPDRLVVVPGGEPFEVSYPSAARVLFVVLPPALVAERYTALDGPVWSVPLDPAGRALCRHVPHLMTAAAVSAGVPRVDEVASVFTAVLGMLVRGAIGETADDPGTALRIAAERLVEERLTEPELSVAWLAARLAVSVRQLHRSFAAAGVGPAGYIRDRRLNACARALTESRASVTALAHRYGFASASHLGVAFRQRFGVSPGRWRDDAAARDASRT